MSGGLGDEKTNLVLLERDKPRVELLYGKLLKNQLKVPLRSQ
jgi:hypothetical protein